MPRMAVLVWRALAAAFLAGGLLSACGGGEPPSRLRTAGVEPLEPLDSDTLTPNLAKALGRSGTSQEAPPEDKARARTLIADSANAGRTGERLVGAAMPAAEIDPAPTREREPAPAARQPGVLGLAPPKSAPVAPVTAAAPAAPEPPALDPPPSDSPPSNPGGVQVQLAALRSETDARADWERLLAAHPVLLRGLDPVIVRADLGARGVFYRLRAGALSDRAAARRLCGALRSRGRDCLVVGVE